ncbi:MAG: RNA polymerase sigma factor [Clostridia bacterium]|nr:RNA polymerase sigma factor [Clostridia bacterium]
MDNASDAYRRFLAGEDDALGVLVCAYRPGLQQYLFGFVHDMDTAEDLTQETFVRLLLKKPKDSGGASFKTWLFTIGGNLARDHLRKAKRRRTQPLADGFDLADPAPTPELLALKAEQQSRLAAALRRLSPTYRQALYLTYYEGFDTEALSAILGKSRHSTSALLYRAKGALRQELEQEEFPYEI